MMRPLDFRQASQIAYTMAATAKTPAASIKISAISKPAIVRALDMGTSLQIVRRGQVRAFEKTPDSSTNS